MYGSELFYRTKQWRDHVQCDCFSYSQFHGNYARECCGSQAGVDGFGPGVAEGPPRTKRVAN